MFSLGQIVRIKCENVLTYRSIEIFPCPKLNLIIGANGSGKSTIISAIILGLGGNAAVVGRATDLKQYIKVGHKTACIEIELYNPEGNVVIKRKFTANGDSRFWYNDKVVSLEKIERLAKRYRIQIDNLCQILPQEKLEHFAKMNDHERLVGTLKTVGNPELSKSLEELKSSKGTEVSLRQIVVTLKNELSQKVAKKDGMEIEVKAIKEKDFLIDCFKLLKQRRAWQLYFHMRQTINIIDDLLKNKQAVYHNMTNVLKRTMAELQASYSNVSNAKETTKKTDNQLLKLIRAAKEKQNEINLLVEKISDIKAAFRQKETRFRTQEADIKTLEDKIQNLRDEIFNVSQIEPEITRVRRLVEEQETAVRQIAHDKDMASYNLESKRNEMNAHAYKLSKLKDVKERKLKLLRENFPDSYKGLQWLEEHRNLFKGRVYGPMYLHLNVNDSNDAKYVENVISYRDLTAFMCELKDDTTTLLKELGERMKLRISVVSALQNVTEDDLRPPIPIESLKKFGFRAFVSDFIDGPDIIVEYMTLTYNLHRIPVGNKHTFSVTSSIPANVRTFFTDRLRLSTKVAQLTGEKIESSSDISDAQFLAAGVNVNEMDELNELHRQCANEIGALEAEYQQLVERVSSGDTRIKELRRELKKLLDRKMAQSRLQETLKAKTRELHRVKNTVIDLDIEKNRCNLEVKVALAQVCNMYIELGSSYKSLFHAFIQYQQDKINEEQTEQVHAKNLRVTAEFVKLLKSEAGSLRKLESKKRRMVKCANNMHEYALKSTSKVDPRNPAFKGRKMFFKLSDNVVVLGKLINKFHAKINCLGGSNDGLNLIREYKQLAKDIASLERKIARKEEKLQNHYGRMEELKQTWLNDVQALVATINTNFRRFFEIMECAGEVCLYQGEEGAEDDFSQYGIHIKVKFRQEGELQILNAQVQSGGERAVSVAIYLLSLQELTSVPFRCIDEINQGMDANNERRIFNLITKATEEKGTTQYFLLTPKLLPNLNFTPHCKIFCPYNGVGSIPHEQISQKMRRSS